MPTSHIIENPYGRIFAHGLTGGNVMLLILDHAGKNLSMPLSAKEAMELGRWLFFNHQEGIAIVNEAAPLDDVELDEDVYQTAPPAPLEPARGGIPALPSSGDALHREAARLFMSDEADGYKSARTGRKGRTGYVADTLGVTSKKAGNLITQARTKGIIPSSFSARPGGNTGGSLPSQWTDEKLREVGKLYMSNAAGNYDEGRIKYTATQLGVSYHSANRAIQRARARGFITKRYKGGKRPKSRSMSWDDEKLALVVKLYNESEYYQSPNGGWGRTAAVADHFRISKPAATMAIAKARQRGLFQPAEELPFISNGVSEVQHVG